MAKVCMNQGPRPTQCMGYGVGSVHAHAFVPLEPCGAKVWCEYHSYTGPTFYRSERAIKEIEKPSKKTWDAYYKWRKTVL